MSLITDIKQTAGEQIEEITMQLADLPHKEVERWEGLDEGDRDNMIRERVHEALNRDDTKMLDAQTIFDGTFAALILRRQNSGDDASGNNKVR